MTVEICHHHLVKMVYEATKPNIFFFFAVIGQRLLVPSALALKRQ